MSENGLLSSQDCEWLLRKITKSFDANLASFTMRPLSDNPSGFLGDHFRLNLKTSDGTEVNLFVKTIPSVQIHADYVDSIDVFKKEVELFQMLIPEFQEIMRSLQVRQWSPECHLARENLLIFEDLSLNYYRLATGRGMLDLNHCIFVMEAMATLHSASIIWEYRNGIRIDERFPNAVKEASYVTEVGHPRRRYLSSAIKALVYLCERIDRSDDAKLLPSIIFDCVKDIGPSPEHQNVLSHGDLWSNNMMFQYCDDKLSNCILIDYQLARYAPCALDLMCCIHLIADKPTRQQHFAKLVQAYEDHLMKHLKKSGVIIGDLAISKQCEKYKLFALVEACLFGISIWLPSDSIGEALGSPTKCFQIIFGDRIPIMAKAFDEDEFFRSQMTTLLNELLDAYEAS
jgi:hypothetical protein